MKAMLNLKQLSLHCTSALAILLLNSCNDGNKVKKLELSEYIGQTKGIQMLEKQNQKYIQLSKEFSVSGFLLLLKTLKDNNIGFAFYDELYPSPSDPGAYLSYSQEKVNADNCWHMTLGNHCWSGGIYQISDSTILIQLSDLCAKDKLKEIEISDVAFFSHYAIQEYNRSKEKNELIRKIHSSDY